MKNKVIFLVPVVILVFAGFGVAIGLSAENQGYQKGYDVGYDEGYTKGYEANYTPRSWQTGEYKETEMSRWFQDFLKEIDTANITLDIDDAEGRKANIHISWAK